MEQHDEYGQLPVNPTWNAIFAMSLGVAGLITSEFLQVSLLTPMAKDVSITGCIAGQAISITAIVAKFTSLVNNTITKALDRRLVLLKFPLSKINSNILVAYALRLTALSSFNMPIPSSLKSQV